MDPHRRDTDQRSVCESTVIVPFHDAHPSVLSETMKLETFNKFSKCLSTIVKEALSIHTWIVDALSWTHTTKVVFDSTCKGPPPGPLVGISGVVPRRFDYKSN